MATILIVEDEKNLLKSLTITLEMDGHRVVAVKKAEEALAYLGKEVFDVILTDLRLPGMDGIELLKRVKRLQPGAEVLIMTAFGTIENAVLAMKLGAFDYITKPFRESELRIRIQKALERSELKSRLRQLERTLQDRYHSDKIVARSPLMREILNRAMAVASSESTVLITGESGTGKELIARAIHQWSPRRDGPFITINCGAIPENLLESELFGHVRGAFTGALSTKPGLIEEADGGTLFMDEIGEASPTIQVKLLRFLELGEFRRVGDNKSRQVNVRLIVATNKDLQKEIAAGRFREDLFYRINVVPIHLPPLRQRKEDIPFLVQDFIRFYAQKLGKSVNSITPEAMSRLLQYDWPGNVRELENTLEYAINFAQGETIEIRDLPLQFQTDTVTQYPSFKPDLPPPKGGVPSQAGPGQGLVGQGSLADIEKAHILQVLQQTGWNRRKACQILKISKATLYRRLKSFGISPDMLK